MINMGTSKAVMYTMNIFDASSRSASTNSCLSMSFTCLAIDMASIMVYFLQVSSLASNLTPALLSAKKTFPQPFSYWFRLA